MNELQAWFLTQCHAFQVGAQDFKSGVDFAENMNSEWQRGWKWARLNNFGRQAS
ncbi:hypothetical protein [Pseudomonas aeruginosa]|uniref:hypothetical protein n=1 Tax=Pseudomonas aeruginosa TaxID=287 RepID=UPI0032B5F7B5